MAYFLDDNVEKDAEAELPGGLVSPATGPAHGGLAGTVVGGAPGSAAGATPGPGGGPPGPDGSGRFVNFERVLNANRDNAQKMSDGLVNKVDAQASKAQDLVNGSVADFQHEALYQSPSYIGTTTYNNDTGYYDPDKVTYDGPQKLADVAPAGMTGAYNTATASLNNLGTPGGVQALIGQDVQGHYSQGMSNLDGALAGATGGKQFNDLATKYAGLGTAMTNANAAVDASLKQANDSTAKTNKDAEATAKKQNTEIDDKEEDRLQNAYGDAIGTDYPGSAGWNERVEAARQALDAYYARTGRKPSSSRSYGRQP